MLGKNFQIAMTPWVLTGYTDRSGRIAEIIAIDPLASMPDASAPIALISKFDVVLGHEISTNKFNNPQSLIAHYFSILVITCKNLNMYYP